VSTHAPARALFAFTPFLRAICTKMKRYLICFKTLFAWGPCSIKTDAEYETHRNKSNEKNMLRRGNKRGDLGEEMEFSRNIYIRRSGRGSRLLIRFCFNRGNYSCKGCVSIMLMFYTGVGLQGAGLDLFPGGSKLFKSGGSRHLPRN
jgi:hypothetical protein